MVASRHDPYRRALDQLYTISCYINGVCQKFSQDSGSRVALITSIRLTKWRAPVMSSLRLATSTCLSRQLHTTLFTYSRTRSHIHAHKHARKQNMSECTPFFISSRSTALGHKPWRPRLQDLAVAPCRGWLQRRHTLPDPAVVSSSWWPRRLSERPGHL